MTWVKICGLTRPEDVEATEVAGADALGFVLIDRSPRVITIDQAATLIGHTERAAFILTKDLPPPDLIAAALSDAAGDADVIVLAQATMAAALDRAGALAVPVLSSPRLGLSAAIETFQSNR